MHGFAAPLGGMFAAPHGAVCAALLPAVLRVNLRALAARAPDSTRRCARFRELAALLTGRPDAAADDGIAWVDGAVPRAGDPRPRPLRADARPTIPALVAKARVASSMKGNPLPLTDEELTRDRDARRCETPGRSRMAVCSSRARG